MLFAKAIWARLGLPDANAQGRETLHHTNIRVCSQSERERNKLYHMLLELKGTASELRDSTAPSLWNVVGDGTVRYRQSEHSCVSRDPQRAFHLLDIWALITNHLLGHLEAPRPQLCGSHLLPTVAFPFARSLSGYRLVSNYLRTQKTAFSCLSGAVLCTCAFSVSYPHRD